MEKYEEAKIEVIVLSSDDVITASHPDDTPIG